MIQKKFKVTKASGQKEQFSYDKYINSLLRAGVDKDMVDGIIAKMQPYFIDGITTQELYQKTRSFIQAKDTTCANRYSLKEALFLLGPSGFPFEKIIGEIFAKKGYSIKTDVMVPGKCVQHEIDVVALKNEKHILIECKFHARIGLKSAVQTPLYVRARFDDIASCTKSGEINVSTIESYLVTTNTKFTSEAIAYAQCAGIQLLSWGYPYENGLEKQLEKEKLYPITTLCGLKASERRDLLAQNIIMCSHILEKPSRLQAVHMSPSRIKVIVEECKALMEFNGK